MYLPPGPLLSHMLSGRKQWDCGRSEGRCHLHRPVLSPWLGVHIHVIRDSLQFLLLLTPTLASSPLQAVFSSSLASLVYSTVTSHSFVSPSNRNGQTHQPGSPG